MHTLILNQRFSVRSHAASRVGSIFSLLVISLMLAGSASAVTQVDNTSNSGDCSGNIRSTIWMAGSFTTGNQVYTLESATTNLFNITSGNQTDWATYSLYSDNAGEPGNLIETMGTSSALPQGSNCLCTVNSSGSVLQPNTTYWIVFKSSFPTQSMYVQGTLDPSESSSSGWTIGNNFARSIDSGASWAPTTCAPKLRIDASANSVAVEELSWGLMKVRFR